MYQVTNGKVREPTAAAVPTDAAAVILRLKERDKGSIAFHGARCFHLS